MTNDKKRRASMPPKTHAQPSAPLRLLDLVWISAQDGVLSRFDTPRPSWRSIYSAMQRALDLAIDSEMRFEEGDYTSVMENFRGDQWGDRERPERDYARAIAIGNESFCRSFERWSGRAPFFWRGERLALGSCLRWQHTESHVLGFEKGFHEGEDVLRLACCASQGDPPEPRIVSVITRSEIERCESEWRLAKRSARLIDALERRPLYLCGPHPRDASDLRGTDLGTSIFRLSDDAEKATEQLRNLGSSQPKADSAAPLVMIFGHPTTALEEVLSTIPGALIVRSMRSMISLSDALEELRERLLLSSSVLSPLMSLGLPPDVLVFHPTLPPGFAEAVADLARFGRFGRLTAIWDHVEWMRELSPENHRGAALRCLIGFHDPYLGEREERGPGGGSQIVVVANPTLPPRLALAEALHRAARVVAEQEITKRRQELSAARSVEAGEADPP